MKKTDIDIIKENPDILIDKGFIEDLIAGIMGDGLAWRRVIISLKEYPYAVTERIFLKKYSYFINDLKKFSAEERMNFSEKISDNDSNTEFVYRLVECIEKCDNYRKVEFICNANRALAKNEITLDNYFRIWNTVNKTTYEDLIFFI